MRLGLIVVGRSEKQSLPALIRKIYQVQGIEAGITTRIFPQGDMSSGRKVAALVSFLVRQHPDMSKVVLCIDSECTDPGEVRQRMQGTEREVLGFSITVPFRYIVVVHALEGWLMTDHEAVGRVLGVDQSRPIRNEPESECKPADVMDELFARHGKDFRKTIHDPQIAAEADPELIRKRSESFNQFVQAVVDL